MTRLLSVFLVAMFSFFNLAAAGFAGSGYSIVLDNPSPSSREHNHIHPRSPRHFRDAGLFTDVKCVREGLLSTRRASGGWTRTRRGCIRIRLTHWRRRRGAVARLRVWLI